MRMPAESLLLKNGKTCVLRSVEPEDAEHMISYMKIMLGETPFLLRTPEEFDYSVEGEAEVLTRRRDDPRALMILAEADGEIVATSDVMPMGTKSRTLHRATLGMSVRKDYWRNWKWSVPTAGRLACMSSTVSRYTVPGLMVSNTRTAAMRMII